MKAKNVILIAEDHATMQKVLALQIRKLGHNVQLASDGQAAVDYFQSNDVCLVLLDLNMPILDGIAAAKLIREHEQHTGRTKTPIVAVTAHSTARDDCFKAGMDDFVVKPILMGDLERIIDRWLLLG